MDSKDLYAPLELCGKLGFSGDRERLRARYELVVRWRANNESYQRIADAFGVTVTTVSHIVKNPPESKPLPPLEPSPNIVGQIAWRSSGLSLGTRQRRHMRHVWIHAMAAKGYNKRDIAAALGVGDVKYALQIVDRDTDIGEYKGCPFPTLDCRGVVLRLAHKRSRKLYVQSCLAAGWPVAEIASKLGQTESLVRWLGGEI